MVLVALENTHYYSMVSLLSRHSLGSSRDKREGCLRWRPLSGQRTSSSQKMLSALKSDIFTFILISACHAGWFLFASEIFPKSWWIPCQDQWHKNISQGTVHMEPSLIIQTFPECYSKSTVWNSFFPAMSFLYYYWQIAKLCVLNSQGQ